MIEVHNYWDFQLSDVVALTANGDIVHLPVLDPDPGCLDSPFPCDTMLVTKLYYTSLLGTPHETKMDITGAKCF